MNTTPYLPEIENALNSHAILHLLDVTREIRHLDDINGPAGRLIGKRLMEYMEESMPGKRFEELTIAQLTAVIDAAGGEYNESYKRSQAFWAARETEDGK